MTVREFIDELELYGERHGFDEKVVFLDPGHNELDGGINYIEQSKDYITKEPYCEISLM